MVDLNNVDLNLLVAFDALMTERSVTRAADRLHIGQSAMSSTLGRLRKLLDDPILVREGRGMMSTPLADTLVGPVRDALSGIEAALSHHGFHPESDHRTFSIIATDRTTLTFLGPLINGIDTEAPHVQLEIMPPTEDYAARLHSGQADVLIIPREVFSDHRNFPHEVLYRDRLVCAVDSANTAVGDTLTVEQFNTAPFLATNIVGTPSLSEMQLDFLGIGRNTRVIAGFGLAHLLIRRGPFLALIHERLARALNFDDGLRLLEPPFELAPITEIMVWSPRSERDPANNWLRERLRRLAADMPPLIHPSKGFSGVHPSSRSRSTQSPTSDEAKIV
ncbi:LysR family transcriptional regulator [[Mycobacterium] burgundiense]|uniref:LysR family transcriptional regulator n=1 Tax=[Mycobacterium] burgundiense TaxID=3064286 RepID=A0ABN9NPA8_9MYCO|nr:LysR family transcriptional regulator [Mycolicibacterium sp. MU0053]CAJ1509984.1 LysR family transcriptional regulator [Mycolicibacterium sp. MU0053]